MRICECRAKSAAAATALECLRSLAMRLFHAPDDLFNRILELVQQQKACGGDMRDVGWLVKYRAQLLSIPASKHPGRFRGETNCRQACNSRVPDRSKPHLSRAAGLAMRRL